jgi:hypothetical protein
MAESERGRPGRELDVSPDDNRSAEVKALVGKIYELIKEAKSTLTALGEESSGRFTKQSLSRQLRDRRSGPDRHVVEYIVRHCCRRLAEAEEPRLAAFIGLWEAADHNPDAGQRSGRAGQAPPEPADPSLVGFVLQLVYGGERHQAAQILLSQYPAGGRELGRILAEVGRRTPGGVADLIDAVAEDAGSERADGYLTALHKSDPGVADLVQAVPRTRPRPPTPPAVPDTEAADTPNVLDLDPRKIDGRRRARLIRQGDVAQVAAEIVAEATATAKNTAKDTTNDHVEDTAKDKFFLRLASLEIGVPKVNIALATDLFAAVCQEDDDDEAVAAALLTQLIEDGHAELAAILLHTVHQIPQSGPTAAQNVLAAMKRPELLSMLDQLAEGTLTRAPQRALPDVLAQAPATVTGAYLLKWELTKHPSSVDISQLPHLPRVLRNMIERDHYGTAQVLSSQMESWDVEAAFYTHPERPESKVAFAVLSVARDDIESAGLLLLALLHKDLAASAQLLFLLEAPRADTGAPGLVASILTAAIRREPTTVVRFVARMARQHDMPARTLDRVANNDAHHGAQLATAMLIEDPSYAQAVLPELIKQNALTLTGELLRQLDNRDPAGPWKLIGHAVNDGNSEAALANLNAYLPGQNT